MDWPVALAKRNMGEAASSTTVQEATVAPAVRRSEKKQSARVSAARGRCISPGTPASTPGSCSRGSPGRYLPVYPAFDAMVNCSAKCSAGAGRPSCPSRSMAAWSR